MHSFTVGFEPSQQGLLAVGIVHSGMIVSLHRSFISSYFMYDIGRLFFELIVTQKKLYGSSIIIAYGLNQTITLPKHSCCEFIKKMIGPHRSIGQRSGKS